MVFQWSYWGSGLRLLGVQWMRLFYTKKNHLGRKQAYFRDFLVEGVSDSGEFNGRGHITQR
uniref:Uncharacterized protein n=1 Tax=Romanomermis culicivorax TaxID=13658 RepID=A0A915JCR9_ROMCU